MQNLLTYIIQRKISVPCKFSTLGCKALFPFERPQTRLQHQARCVRMRVVCHWCRQVESLGELENHLTTRHGHRVLRVTQEGGSAIRINKVLAGRKVENPKLIFFRFCLAMLTQAGLTAQVAVLQILSLSGCFSQRHSLKLS